VTRAHAVWVIYASLVGALLFTLLPLPMDWRGLRPDVAALALFYWVLALPHRVGGLMLATLLLLYNYQRIRQFDLLQQSLAILGLMLLSAGVEQWLRSGINVPAGPWAGVAGMICSMLFWVPIRTVLRHSRRYYEVY